MKKGFCDRCEKEIKLKKCYEIDFGLADIIEEGYWCALTTDVKHLCPSCYKEFMKFMKLKK